MLGSKVALITNASTELGKSITHALLDQFQGVVYIVERHVQTALDLVEYFEIRGYNMKYLILEIGNDSSVDLFCKYLTTICNGIDVFIHGDESEGCNSCRSIEKRYFYNVKLFEIIFQLLRPNSRFIYVSNAAGNLHLIQSKTLYETLLNPALTVAKLTGILQAYLKKYEDNKRVEQKPEEVWSGNPEVIFRTAITLLIRIYQKKISSTSEEKFKNIYFNAIHSGFTKICHSHENDRSLLLEDEYVKPIMRLVHQKCSDFAQQGNFIGPNSHSIGYL